MGELYHEISCANELKERLIQACKVCEPSLFFPALLTPNVKVAFPNKVRFYQYFKSILKSAKKEKKTEQLRLSIEAPYEINFKGGENYCFYGPHPLIKIELKEEGDILLVDIHPF